MKNATANQEAQNGLPGAVSRKNATMRTYSYRFDKHTPQVRQNAVVFALRRDGFAATLEYDRDNRNDLLVTNARVSEIAMSFGTATVVNF